MTNEETHSDQCTGENCSVSGLDEAITAVEVRCQFPCRAHGHPHYRVAWRSRLTGATGHGDCLGDVRLADKWVKEENGRHPDIEHWRDEIPTRVAGAVEVEETLLDVRLAHSLRGAQEAKAMLMSTINAALEKPGLEPASELSHIADEQQKIVHRLIALIEARKAG